MSTSTTITPWTDKMACLNPTSVHKKIRINEVSADYARRLEALVHGQNLALESCYDGPAGDGGWEQGHDSALVKEAVKRYNELKKEMEL